MNVKAMLVEKTAKNGNKYTCIELYITENVKKMVFLTESELELIRLSHK